MDGTASKRHGLKTSLHEALKAVCEQIDIAIPRAKERIPGLDGVRHLVVVDKIAPTPARYPRRVGVPVKRPLG